MNVFLAGVLVNYGSKMLAVLCLLLTLMSSSSFADNTDPDFQSWNMARVTHVEGDWSFSLQYEVRFRDNASTRDESIFKPYLHYNFSERFGLAFG